MPTSFASMRTRWQLSTERTSRDVLERILAAGPGLTATTEQWLSRQTLGLCGLQRAHWKHPWQALTSSCIIHSATVGPCQLLHTCCFHEEACCSHWVCILICRAVTQAALVALETVKDIHPERRLTRSLLREDDAAGHADVEGSLSECSLLQEGSGIDGSVAKRPGRCAVRAFIKQSPCQCTLRHASPFTSAVYHHLRPAMASGVASVSWA